MSYRKFLYLPIETKSREMDARILLACHAAQYGFTSVLGHKAAFFEKLESFPPGVYFHKDLGGYQTPPLLRKLKDLKHRVVALDEEGLVLYDGEKYLRRRVSAESLSLVDQFFAWGDFQAKLISERHPEFEKKIYPVGNPRFDFLNKRLRSYYQRAANDLVGKFGKFILINTKFSASNHFNGPDGYYNLLSGSNLISTPEEEAFVRGYINYNNILKNEFLALIKKLSEEVDKKIVVRPHPSENKEFWIEELSKKKNVIIDSGGNVHHWILASDYVIHNGCTTGIESFLLDKKLILFEPVKDPVYDIPLPNAFGEKLLSSAEVVEFIARNKEPRINTNTGQILSEYLALSGRGLAAEVIAEAISRLEISRGTLPHISRSGLKDIIRSISRLVPDKFIDVLPGSWRVSRYRKQQRLVDQKFGRMNLDEVVGAVDSIRGILKIEIDIKVRALTDNLYCIYSSDLK